MEARRHPLKRTGQDTPIAGMNREEGITPTAGGQRLDLNMRKDIQLLGDAGPHAPVEENRGILLDFPNGLGQALRVLAGDEELMFPVILIAGKVQPAPLHAVVTPGTIATGHRAVAHVKEQPFHIVPLKDLLGLRLQFANIGGVVHAVLVPASSQCLAPFPIFAILKMADPTGVRLGIMLIHPHADVRWRHDTALAAGFDLFAQQIEFQAGVSCPRLSRIVAHTMVALREQGDPVDSSLIQHGSELISIEVRTHIRDKFRGMKIQMDLTKASSHQVGP